VTDRRAFVAGTFALAAFPVHGAKPPPPPKIGAIRWPGPGYELHGYMAVPAKARGPQPAVLVVHDRDGADQFALSLTDAIALAGYVACAPKALASLDEGVATVCWLATNGYATGKVAAVGLGWGGALVERIAAAPGILLSCGIAFGNTEPGIADGAIPILRMPALSATQDRTAYAASWQQAVDFLDAHLRPSRKR
jgi:carboxymethylenebutenolidase